MGLAIVRIAWQSHRRWRARRLKMFKHILIPTDGSKLSEAALRAGMEFAKEQDSQVTVLYIKAA